MAAWKGGVITPLGDCNPSREQDRPSQRMDSGAVAMLPWTDFSVSPFNAVLELSASLPGPWPVNITEVLSLCSQCLE